MGLVVYKIETPRNATRLWSGQVRQLINMPMSPKPIRCLLLSLALISCKGDKTPKETMPTEVATPTEIATPTEVATPDPKPESKENLDSDTLRIVVGEEAVFIDGQSLDDAALAARLGKEREANPNLKVALVAGPSIFHGRVVALMDIVKSANIAAIGITAATTTASPFPRPTQPNDTADHDSLVRDVPQNVVHSRYGAPDATTRFMASQGAGEMRVEILNDYPASDPKSATTEILEETWRGDGFTFVVFSHKKAGEWVGLQALSYNDGVEF